METTTSPMRELSWITVPSLWPKSALSIESFSKGENSFGALNHSQCSYNWKYSVKPNTICFLWECPNHQKELLLLTLPSQRHNLGSKLLFLLKIVGIPSICTMHTRRAPLAHSEMTGIASSCRSKHINGYTAVNSRHFMIWRFNILMALCREGYKNDWSFEEKQKGRILTQEVLVIILQQQAREWR